MLDPARRQIVFINAAHSLTHYSLLILPTAALVMAVRGGPFGPDYGPILALATGMFLFYGAGSLPQGFLAQRFGRKTLMSVFFFGVGLSLAAAAFTDSRLALAVALGAAGMFASIYHPIGTAMLVDAAGDTPGRSIGVNGVFGNLGVACAPVVSALLAETVGWRWAFLVPGVAAMALGLAWLRVPVIEGTAHRRARPFPVIPHALVRRAVIVLLLIAVVSGLVFNSFVMLLPKLMQDRLATNPGLLPLVGAAAFAVTVCGAATQFTVGRMIDRTTLKRVFLPLGVVLAPGLAALAVAQSWLVLPAAALVAAAIFGQVTVNETMTARYISPALRAQMYSVRFFVGFLGAAAAPPLVGLMQQRTGSLVQVIGLLAAFALITMGCALFFPDRKEELRPELWAAAAASGD
ncbi:MAG: MFS transporter [Acetobacteraceae bacterium]